jgi:hypothetical protein
VEVDPQVPEEHPAAPYEGDYSIDPEPEFTPDSLGMPSEAELAAEAGEGLELSELLEGVGEGGEVAAEAAEGIGAGEVLLDIGEVALFLL